MQVYVLLSVTGLFFVCICKNMISEATTVQWAIPFNEATSPETTDQYVTSNTSLKFNRLNRVKAKWSGNDIWEAQARHSTNYTLSSYSTTSTSPPKRGSFPKSKRRKGTQSPSHPFDGRLPMKRIPAKVKKGGQLHRRTRPISPKKGSVTTTTSTTAVPTSISTTTYTSTSSPKRSGGSAYENANTQSKMKTASLNFDTGTTSKSKYKRKPSKPVIRVTVTDRPISSETEMTSIAPSSSTTSATSPLTPSTLPPTTRITTVSTTTTTTIQTPNSSPTKIVNLPSHLTKRPILPSRTMTKKTTSTPAPALSTTTHKYYPKTSNTLLSLLSASTTPAVTIPNTPFLFMEDNSFLTRLSISLFYSSIAIAPVIFTLFSGLAATKRKRKKRDLHSAHFPYSFHNQINPYNNTKRSPPPNHKDQPHPHHKTLPHFLAELLKEIESTLPTNTTAR